MDYSVVIRQRGKNAGRSERMDWGRADDIARRLNRANQDEARNATWKPLAFVEETSLVIGLPVIVAEWRIVE